MSLWSKLGGLFGGSSETFTEAWRVDVGGHPVALAAAGSKHLAVLTGEGRLLSLALADGAKHFEVEAHAAGALSLDVLKPVSDSPRGHIATGGMDGVVRVWSDIGELQREFSLGRGWVTFVVWRQHDHFSDNPVLIAAHGRSVVTLDYRDDERESHGPLPSSVGALAISPDRTRAAVGYFGGVDVLWLQNESAPQTLPWTSSIVSLAWRPDGSVIAAGCQDSAVHFWRMPSGKDSMMGGYPGKPKVLVWSPKGDLLGTAAGQDAVLWDFATGPEGTSPIQLHGHAKSITAMVWSPDGKTLATGARDGRVLLHNVADGAVLQVIELGASIEGLLWDAGLVVACASGFVVRFAAH